MTKTTEKGETMHNVETWMTKTLRALMDEPKTIFSADIMARIKAEVEKRDKNHVKNTGVKMRVVGWRPCTELYLMFNGQCQKCFKLLTFEAMTIDHLHPQSERETYKGKSIHEVENLTVLCLSCNAAKNDTSAEKFFGVDELNRIKAINSKRLSKEVINSAVGSIAQQKPHGKYARLALNGRFFKAA